MKVLVTQPIYVPGDLPARGRLLVNDTSGN
jgi:hypothetical protein